MPITLQKSTESALVQWSASHLSNNLTINRSSESRRSTLYGISHKSGFTMVTVPDSGTKRIQGQVICRIMGNNNNAAPESDARFTVYVIQAAFINLPIRNLLVLACTKSVQIYELDGTTNLHIHMLDKNNTNKTESSIYARGIAGIGQNLLCVGNHQGEILVFNIPPKGNNIFLKETIHGHQFGITYLVSNANLLISSDTSGVILIKNIRTMSRINEIQSINESGVTSLSMWNNCIVASYANGMIHLFDPENAQICGSIAAHARCINAIDCNEQGLLASVGDDCYVRIWKLSGDAESLQISHECNYHLDNSQLVGVKFLNLSRADLAISAYDSNDIIILRAI
ncbi:unnamed protein product [Rotaria socialis]|uniref:WD repeat-containing protein 54 beta-propeller domain-containing protein n=1 Tax=Rotaria socialis TaxID=392032 RepID=A0A817XIU6_9BILA|nr:unnamed protein product [Rotaria socialis]CAF3342505.1 unnamed protein product [Rotaria socialis]CAF3368918.1 unnamed protein product [Rotaria socialis]CAF3368950.1 unnamed protein product [Rotaria socialis]CAF3415301.1 unnamed protein product [Rotaria socialis]